MYDFISHTWNTIKGECFHDCSYCYMKKWGKLNPVRFDEKELKTDLGCGNFIFVGSSCDMFAENITDEWIKKTFNHMIMYNNQYLIQTKNPKRMHEFMYYYDIYCLDKINPCTTIESNRFYKNIMNNSPTPKERAYGIGSFEGKRYITIEPILDFDLDEFVDILKRCNPTQVNIGSNTSFKIKLPEPSKEKVLALINELSKFTIIHKKNNLKRLL